MRAPANLHRGRPHLPTGHRSRSARRNATRSTRSGRPVTPPSPTSITIHFPAFVRATSMQKNRLRIARAGTARLDRRVSPVAFRRSADSRGARAFLGLDLDRSRFERKVTMRSESRSERTRRLLDELEHAGDAADTKPRWPTLPVFHSAEPGSLADAFSRFTDAIVAAALEERWEAARLEALLLMAAIVWNGPLLPPERRVDARWVARIIFPAAPEGTFDGLIDELTRRRADPLFAKDSRRIVDLRVRAIADRDFQIDVCERSPPLTG